MARRGELQIKTYPIENDYVVFWNRKLGSGISGPVRICQHKQTGDHFALKCLQDRAKSRTEVDLHWRCSGHKHVVACVDVYQNELTLPGETQPRPCLLMVLELMEGGELFDRIRKKVSFTEKEASEITDQVASALFHIHGLNIAHRDLKPENLLLKDKSDVVVVKLTDFGFAKVDKGDLMTPQFTPYYVSPQVLEAQRHHRARKLGNVPAGSQPYTYDKSCDMWSLGVIVYIMLCGYPPFFSENPRKQLSQGMKRRIMQGEYDFPAPEWSKVSDLAKDVVKRLLVINPNERMTVPELVQHQWLNSSKAPNTELQSPHHMLDEDAFHEAVVAHKAILADMRLPSGNFLLDETAAVNNPLVLKRKLEQEHRDGLNEATASNQVAVVTAVSEDPGVKAIRDMIAFLYMPPLDKIESPVFEDFLRALTLTALQHISDARRLEEVLAAESWNGREYSRPVSKIRMAKNLSDMLMSQEWSYRRSPVALHHRHPHPSSR